MSYSDCYQIFTCSVLEVELHVHVPVISLRSMWCIMEDWVESNSACNHVNDKKNWMTMWWESDLLILRQYIYRELDHKVLWTINPKYYKIQERNYTSYVYIFIKKVQQLHVHMTLTVHTWCVDIFQLQAWCVHISYRCPNWAGDNQLHSRILL